MSDTIDMLHYALGMAAKGHPVFPVGSDKKPLVQGGFKAATTDQGQIRKWWTRHPDAGIAMPTGPASKCWVLDIDLPHGPETLAMLEAEHGPLPETPTQQTGGGGKQMFWSWNGRQIKNSAGQIGPGIDVRGDGGYVVMPPSMHSSGHRYQWIVTASTQPAPEWLIDLAMRPCNQATTPQASPRQAPAGTGTPYGLAAMERECGRIALAPEGQRNDALNRAAHALGQLVAGGEIDQAQAVEALLTAAIRAGLPENEARKTIDSGMTAGMAAPRPAPNHDRHHAPGPAPGPEYGPEPPPPGAEAGQAPRPNRFAAHAITGQGIIERFFACLKESWRVKSILPKSSMLIEIYGPPDKYKSFIAIDMGGCISEGMEYHGRTTSQCHVLYIAAEGQAGVLKRLVAWMRAHDIAVLEHFTVLPIPCMLDHDDDLRDAIDFILSMVERPGVVIVDTLARSMMGDENSTQDMNKVVYSCGKITEATGAQVVLIHHTGKDATKGSRGSIALEGATDTQFEVVGNKSMTATMLCKRMKDYEKCPPITFKMEVEATGYVSDDGEPVTSLVPVLDQEAQAAGIAAKGTGLKLSGARRVAYDALKDGTKYQRRLHVDAWRDLAYRSGIAGEDTSTDAKQKAFRRALEKLHDLGIVDCEDDHWWTT